MLALYGLLTIPLRGAIQLRRTGSTGFKGLDRRSGPLERTAGALFAASLALCLAGVALQLGDRLNPISSLEGAGADLLGGALASLGIALTVLSQLAMGDAWRIGMDPGERTALVTSGPFSIVRNPIYAAMIPSFVGIALLAPNALTLGAVAALLAALELQTRLVEEPHLLRMHGERYAGYAARVGRFLPLVGRLGPGREQP